MVEASAIVVYLVFCVLAGLCGRYRRMGFFGTFLISLVVTPLVMLLLLILTAPLPRVEQDRGPRSN